MGTEEGAEAERRARLKRLEELEEQLQAVEKEDAAQAEEERIAYLEQKLLDRQRQNELQKEHGYNRILGVEFTAWKPGVGAATRFVCLLPDGRSRLFKRAQVEIARNRDDSEANIESAEKLAKACIRYPHPEREPELYKATHNLAPGILGNLARQIVDKVSGRERDTRKK